MNTKVLQITVEDLRQVVDEMVEQKLAVLFKDTENDLELTDELKTILARQNERIKNGDRGESLEDVAARLVDEPFLFFRAGLRLRSLFLGDSGH